MIPMKFKEILKDALLENSRRGNFLRIYPAKGTHIYDKFFKSVRPHNVFLYKWLYTNDILPMGLESEIVDPALSLSLNSRTLPGKKEDMSSAQSTGYQSTTISTKSKTKKPQRPQTVKVGSNPSMKDNSEKIIITGDDVLIEYVQRLISSLSIIPEDSLSPDIRLAVDKFILHYVWHSKDPAKENPTALLKERLQTRYEEMRQRRKRLVRSIYKREGKLDVFEASYKKMSQQKMTVLKNFDGNKLEDMLKTSTKNVAQEVVSILINHSRDHDYGLLPDLEKNYIKVTRDSMKNSHSSISYGNSRERISFKGISDENQHELEACAEDDEKSEQELEPQNVLASSCSVNPNKFTNITDFNNKLANQPPQLPPTVNYNNYFNNSKYRYSSKSRKAQMGSNLTATDNDSRVKIKNMKRNENSSQRHESELGARRNSFRSTEFNRDSFKPEHKTTRGEVVKQAGECTSCLHSLGLNSVVKSHKELVSTKSNGDAYKMSLTSKNFKGSV